MGLTHIRTPKNFVLEDRLERYAAAIEQRPETYCGRWGEACAPCGGADCGDVTRVGATCDNAPCGSASRGDMPGFGRVHLDLGCGKGAYLVARAQREPDALFIGMDTEPICIAYAAQNIVEAGLSNAIVLARSADSIERLFGPGELAGITLNFPTPFPKRKFARKRLTSVDHLLSYRRVLAPGAAVTLRTDSQPLHDYTLTQLDAAGYRVLWASNDTRAEHPEHPETEYERRLAEQGAAVYGVCAIPGPEPTPEQIQAGRDAEQSLVAYLPRNLDSVGYIPLGMEGAVLNLRNRQRNEQAHNH